MTFKCRCRDCQRVTGGGFAAAMLVPSSAFRLTKGRIRIPYPYLQYDFQVDWRHCQMKTVRIPLRAFTLNNSGVDLTDIRKVVIRFQSAGLVGIDDIQITQ